MKSIALNILLLFLSVQANAKNDIFYIELQNETFTVKNAQFYISNVVDVRGDTTFIGMARVGAFNKATVAKLSRGVERGFYNFISGSLHKQDDFTGIELKVTEFKISERATMNREYGEVVLKVDFYAYNEDYKPIRIYRSESFISESALDVTNGHEKRIRNAIIECLEKFATSDWREKLSLHPVRKGVNELDSNVISELEEVGITFQPITINPRNPKYQYYGTPYATLIQLEFQILSSGNTEISEAYYKYKSSLNTAKAFGYIGGGLMGYPVGAALAGAELNVGLLFAGIGVTVIAVIIESKAKKRAVKIIELYNAQSDK